MARATVRSIVRDVDEAIPFCDPSGNPVELFQPAPR